MLGLIDLRWKSVLRLIDLRRTPGGQGLLSRCCVVLALGAAGGAGSRAAAAGAPVVVKRHEETVSVLPARTSTFEVSYPDALEFAGAVYSGAVKIIGPNPAVGGRRPKLSLVRVLSSGSAEGDSVLRVRIRNANPPGTLAARAEIVAVTREPADP
jgi:hypothetical protein